MRKKQVIAYVRSLGGEARYAGNTVIEHLYKDNVTQNITSTIYGSVKTMYISDKNYPEGKQTIEECVLNKFGYNLSFRLVTV